MEIIIANKSHAIYAKIICKTIADSANIRGTGIAKRTTDYIIQRMNNQNAVIALDEGKFVGFCYIEKWSHGKFVANSGLIVHPDYRGKGIAKLIKEKTSKHIQEMAAKRKGGGDFSDRVRKKLILSPAKDSTVL